MPKEAQSTQQFVDVDEIKDGVIILKGGALRRVLMVSGINFELKSEEEQSVILGAYQEFLNSLDFSLQIIVHSRKFNVENYLGNLKNKLEVEQNDLLKEQISEYMEFIKSFVDENEIMSKTFFAVVPYDVTSVSEGAGALLENIPFLGKKKKAAISEQNKSIGDKINQLDQRTDQVINGLSNVGLRAVILNDEELIELFYNLYNPQPVERTELQIAKE